MSKLFDNSDSEEEVRLKTENEYAKKYDNWRQKEELYKLQQKYGDNPQVSSSDSDDDSEPEISEKVEKDFLKTLALLKTKDPRIYDKNYTFFAENNQEDSTKSKDDDTKHKDEPKKQKAKKKEAQDLSQMFQESDESEDDENILKVVAKDVESKPKTDKLKEFLTGKVEHLEDETEKDLEPLKKLWSDPNITEKEKFLRDYILNSRHIHDPDDEDPAIGQKLRDDEALEDDEKTIEEQKNFERAYNFRFEEPDPEFIKRYPRTMSSIRPKDDRRARKRAEVRARKEEDRKRKMDEIARMKSLKLKEIQEKIAKIKQVTGNEELAFREEDIEGDFDPEEHDKRMRAIFDSEYYQEADDEKPVFPDLDEELEIENWESELNQMEEEPHCEDNDFNMDADYNPKKVKTTTLMEEIKETLGKKKRNRKRKSKLAELLTREKPKFDPLKADKTYSEFVDEYYKLDCEDIIAGDLPTRFKYRDVVANDFGLSVEEILLADDNDLNKWVPLKKTVKYRPDFVEKGEINTYKLKAQDVDLKKKILPSLFKEYELDNEAEQPQEDQQKTKKKKKRNKEINQEIVDTTLTEEQSSEKRKHPKENGENNIENASAASTAPKKKRRRKRNKNKLEADQQIGNSITHTETPVFNNSGMEVKPKRKKNKNLENNEQNNSSNKEMLENKSSPNINKSKQKKNKSKEGLRTSNKGSNKKQVSNKMKGIVKNKDKIKHVKNKGGNKLEGASDLLSTLSDERLKAYGLNPKKYRNFLKYKQN